MEIKQLTMRLARRYWRTVTIILTPVLALAIPLYVQAQGWPHSNVLPTGPPQSVGGITLFYNDADLSQEGRGDAAVAVMNISSPTNVTVAASADGPASLTRPGAWCAFCLVVMAVFWLLEVIPIQVTALLPVLLFPLTGVLSTKETCEQYMNSVNMLLLGGMMVAAATEHSQLHLRITLRVLISIGAGVKWIVLGLMVVTMFLSMWISNTAATAMMAPIVGQIIHVLTEERLAMLESDASTSDAPPLDRGRLCAALYISVAYAANCGGTGTLTGTNSNLVLFGQLQELFGMDTGLTYASFMLFGVPSMLLCTLLAWIWIVVLFLGLRQLICCGEQEGQRFAELRRALRQRYRELGPLTFHQRAVGMLFALLVLLWFFRQPRFMPGWQDLFEMRVADATPAIFVVILMFVIPARPGAASASEGLLTWKVARDKVQWGVMLILGGGFALARAIRDTGLSVWVGDQLSASLCISPFALVLIMSLFTAMVTEVVGNVVTAAILLPVLAGVAQRAGINPLYVMLPVTLSCSYAFMLPVATAPNAIVYQAGGLRGWDMVKAGLVMNVLCVTVLMVVTHTVGVALFDLYTFPAWANATAG